MEDPLCTLDQLLAQLGQRVTLATGDADAPARPITGVSVWLDGDPAPRDPACLVVYPKPLPPRETQVLPPDLLVPGLSLIIALRLPERVIPLLASARLGSNIVLAVDPSASVAEIVAETTQLIRSPEQATSRRLAALQRSLTQALAESAPIPALTTRLSKTCNAATGIVAASGQPLHATGPLPFGLLHEEIRRARAETQLFDVDGWRGVAVRLADPVAGGHYGWLVAAARRPGFPDPLGTAAVQVAAALVETSLRIEVVSRRQDRAIRSSLLEQAISLQATRHDAELSGRIASLGVSLDEESRVLVLRPARIASAADRPEQLTDLADKLSGELTRSGTAHLVTVRDGVVVALVQAAAAEIRRLLIKANLATAGLLTGIGRKVPGVGDVSDSFNDALLAITYLRRRAGDSTTMAYEDFDFATRLFADVGLDRMAAWAEDFLRPLEGREAIMEGLTVYFEHEQNINTAADHLSIHHNSLRYRLSKIESLLRVDLKDPAAVSSIFLALTARNLHGATAGMYRKPVGRRSPDRDRVTATEASGAATGGPSPSLGGVPGVVLSD